MIDLHRISKTYRMGTTAVTALADLDLSIPEQTFTTIVGRSGSGKSTLLHLLAAMDTPTTGTIRVGDWQLNDLDRTQQAQYRREMVGLVFQQFNLVPTMTAWQNVELPLILAGLPPAERPARIEQGLQRVGLGHRMTHRPTELSGGEQQRVALARALVLDPPLLLADEPTGNLDSTTSAEIVALLSELHQSMGKTIVVVTHEPDEFADAATQVVALSDGRRVESAGSMPP